MNMWITNKTDNACVCTEKLSMISYSTHIYALAGYYRICRILLHIFLTSVTSRWQKSMENSGYGMAAQESRNDSPILIVTTSGYMSTI